MAETDKVPTDLTPKERKVLNLVLEEYDNHRIAEILHCEPSTIDQDVCRICNKFRELNLIDFKGKDRRVALVMACKKMQQQGDVEAD